MVLRRSLESAISILDVEGLPALQLCEESERVGSKLVD
jgi:hypothetical protein